MPSPYRGRFAPSPTGPLHAGNARTALLAWLAARAAGGAIAMRIEDIDGPRVRPGAEARLLSELAWLGLDWDEGPDEGGPCAPYRQSERLDRYAAALTHLQDAGLVYPCYCTRAEVAAVASAPHAGEEGPRYTGRCRTLTATDRAERSATRRPAWRFRVDPGTIAFDDGVHGSSAFDPSEQVGDFVVSRSDGVFAYQLAVVVDDIAMGITDVLRGDDLLASTARQILLYRALGAAPPRFAHVPLIVGTDGQRLAKRHGALSLFDLAALGTDPRAVVGLLASLSGLAPVGAHVTPAELVAGFTLARIPREPAVLDPERLTALGATRP